MVELALALGAATIGLVVLGWALFPRRDPPQLEALAAPGEPLAPNHAGPAELMDHLGATRVRRAWAPDETTQLWGTHQGVLYGLKVRTVPRDGLARSPSAPSARQTLVEVHVRTDSAFDALHLALGDEAPAERDALGRLTAPVRQLVRSLSRDAQLVHRDGFVATHASDQTAAEVTSLVDRTTRLAFLLKGAPASQGERLAAAYRHEGDDGWRRQIASALVDDHPNSPVLRAMLDDPDPTIRVLAAIPLRQVPQILSALDSSVALLPRVFGALRGTPEFEQVLRGASNRGVDLSDPEHRWILREAIVRPTPALEPVLLRCTALGPVDFRLSAVHSLTQVGTVAAVPTLRALAEGWAKPRLAASASEAIEAIGARAGAHPGAVSMAEPGGGEVSLTGRAHGGRLAVAGEPEEPSSA